MEVDKRCLRGRRWPGLLYTTKPAGSWRCRTADQAELVPCRCSKGPSSMSDRECRSTLPSGNDSSTTLLRVFRRPGMRMRMRP